MKLYSYIVRIDRGLAPNPFWGYCTLAVCTPNHVGIYPNNGDWVFGTTPADRGNKLIYAMQVSEVLRFDKYYTDSRFEKKKPNVKGNWRERCGDNMYYLDNGEWKQHRTMHHHEPETINKDLKYPLVYIAEHFYYFGDKATEIPTEYQELIWKRQGCSGKHDPAIVEAFLVWLQKTSSLVFRVIQWTMKKPQDVVVVSEMSDMLKGEETFNEQRFVAALNRLPEIPEEQERSMECESVC